MSYERNAPGRKMPMWFPILIVIALTVIFIFWLKTPTKTPVTLVNIADNSQSIEGSGEIETGLLRAIKSCTEAGGTTGIERERLSYITCAAHDYTYVYMNWSWVPYGL